VLETEGKKFLVHRNILCAVSEYFEKLFTIEVCNLYKNIFVVQTKFQRHCAKRNGCK